MPIPIIIREQSSSTGSFSATVQFDTYGAACPITITNPHSHEQEEQLEWYFEEWLRFPFTDKTRAESAAGSITAYGESLFSQVFRSNPDVYMEYQKLRTGDILLEIIGTPEFHALHWESLKDPNQPRPLAVEKPIIRKNITPVAYQTEMQRTPQSQLRVLLLTARPGGNRDVSYRTISRPLVDALETGKVAATIDIVRPGSFEALVKHLEKTREQHGDGYYHMLHLDLHGALLTYQEYQEFGKSKKEPTPHLFGNSGNSDYAQTAVEPYEEQRAYLLFEDNETTGQNGGNLVSADDLGRLLSMRQVPIVVLNACQSGKQVGVTETSLGSALLHAGVQLVVAMGYSVTVSAARLLMTTLYEQLLEGREPAAAIRRARLELYNAKHRQAAYNQKISLEDWVLPVIYQNTPPCFNFSNTMSAIPVIQKTYAPPKTMYKFVGRDLDVLQIERRLLIGNNVLLVQGMGGAGKTTLLHHLGWWWQKTRFVETVFYFGYDAKAYHVQEILGLIGAELGLPLNGRIDEDRYQVLRALKSTRHLLILDNMESITGERLAIPNTLTEAEQQELRDFLQELVGGRTLVLLGSRSGEKWLQPHPLQKRAVYDLPGLDNEAQSMLADMILKATNTPRYPEQKEHREEFKRLLKLLGGYPLAMEVVLGNLAHSTPAELIRELEAADINLDIQEETAKKTESILKCIDYSHSNLSEEAQLLLLVLAPFTGVLNKGWMDQYSEKLKSQKILADLPYDQWPVVLQDAERWGLLKPHEQFGKMGYLSLQPVFPFFLRSRLNEPGQAERKEAIETAFREHYEGIGGTLSKLTDSKEADEQQIGHLLIGVEYENLYRALQIALRQHTSIRSVFYSLSKSLDKTQQHEQGLELGTLVMQALERYPKELLDGQLGDELVGVMVDNIGTRFLNLQRYAEAGNAYEKALKMHNALTCLSPESQAKSRATILHQLGRVAEEQREWSEAERYYKDALKIKIEYNDRYAQAGTLHQLGMVAEEQREWSEAERYYKDALKIYIEYNDRYAQAGTLHQLGRVAEEQREWSEAERYYKDALKIYIEYNDRYAQAGTLHQLGRVAEEQREWSEAERYYKDALKIYIEYNDRYAQASSLHQLGMVAQEQREWSEAERYYKDALKIYIEYNDRYEQAGTLHQLGRVAEEQREWSEAERYYKDALKIYIEYNDRYEQAGTLHQLGRVAEEQREWSEAISYGLEAAEIFTEYHDQHSLQIVLGGLTRIWQETKDRYVIEKLSSLLNLTHEECEELLN